MTTATEAPGGTVGEYWGDNEAADRAAIHNLLMAYGATLDRRDFDGFAQLFGDDGVYILGEVVADGPLAAENMKENYRTSEQVAKTPNFHMFFNEVITFTGPDSARASSGCVYMVSEGAFPVPGPSALYEDELAKKDGRWYFKSRRLKRIDNTPHVR